MPQSKKNVNISISREVHAKLLDIVEKSKTIASKKTGFDTKYTMGDVIEMLVDSYKSE